MTSTMTGTSSHTKPSISFTLTTDGPMDERGNTPHTLRWFDENYHMGPQNRAQCFLCNIEKHITRLTEEGHTVVRK